MEFTKQITDVEIIHVRDVEDGKAQFELQFWGGALRFYGKRDVELVGRHKSVTVKARMYAPGKIAVSVSIDAHPDSERVE